MARRNQTGSCVAAVLAAGFALGACNGGGGGDGGGLGTLSPSATSVPVGGSKAFTVAPVQSTTWSVNGAVGGNATIGTISAGGVYTAPVMVPGTPTVTISASAAGNTATVTIVSRFVDEGAHSVGCSNCTPSSVSATDVNADGLSDIITANTDGSNASVLRNNGNGICSVGSFCPPEQYSFGSGSARPDAAVVADFSGDSIPDLVIADAVPDDGTHPQRAIRVRLGTVSGIFDTGSEAVTLLPPDSSGPPALVTGHLDGSALDLVVANLTADTVSILSPHADGTFSVFKEFSSADGISSPVGVVVADLNGDSLDDLAIANGGNEVLVFLQTSSGRFDSPTQHYPLSGTMTPSAITALDLNGDNFPELAVTLVNGSSVGSLQLLISSGGGFFSSGQSIATGVQPAAVAAADLNGDGLKDLVVVNSAPSQAQGSVSQYLSKGDGTVFASETTPVGAYPLSIAVGDFNGDGFADLAVANSFDDTVTILRNQGD